MAGSQAAELRWGGTDWRKENTSAGILRRDPQIAGLHIGSVQAPR